MVDVLWFTKNPPPQNRSLFPLLLVSSMIYKCLQSAATRRQCVFILSSSASSSDCICTTFLCVVLFWMFEFSFLASNQFVCLVLLNCMCLALINCIFFPCVSSVPTYTIIQCILTFLLIDMSVYYDTFTTSTDTSRNPSTTVTLLFLF